MKELTKGDYKFTTKIACDGRVQVTICGWNNSPTQDWALDNMVNVKAEGFNLEDFAKKYVADKDKLLKRLYEERE